MRRTLMLMVIPDPDKTGSNEPQDIPGFGVFPVAVADTDKSKTEWEKLISQTGLPLIVKDVRSDVPTTEKEEEV